MAGSRKGEKRGAAGSPVSKARGGGSPAAPSAPKIAKKTGKLRLHAHQVKNEEYVRDIQRALYGEVDGDIEPREVMLEAMRYFHGQAGEAKQHRAWVLEQITNCKNDADFDKIETELNACDIRIRDAYLLAMDAGFKVAPYMHSKLASIEISGPDKQPIEIMHILLNEIAGERAGPSWAQESSMMIEHEPVTHSRQDDRRR